MLKSKFKLPVQRPTADDCDDDYMPALCDVDVGETQPALILDGEDSDSDDGNCSEEDIPQPARTRICASSTVAWDETEMRIGVNINPLLTRVQQTAPWHIMISVASLLMSIVDGDPDVPDIDDSITPVRAPVPLVDTKARTMFHGLFRTPLSTPFEHSCRDLDSDADACTRTFCCDGASANAKLVAHAAQSELPNTMVAVKWCELHGIKLCETSVLAIVRYILLAGMHSLALLFRSASQYFLRMALAVDGLVRGKLMMKKLADMPPNASAYADALIDFFRGRPPLRHTRHVQNNKYGGSDFTRAQSSSPGFLRLVSNWIELSGYLNGDWSQDAVVHYSSKPDDPVYRSYVIKRVTELSLCTVLAYLPPIPASNKWTQVAGCAIWIMMALGPHSILRELFGLSFRDLLVTVMRQAAKFEESLGDVQGELAVSLNYHKLVGSRMQGVFAMLTNADTLSHVTMFALVVEALQFYTTWLLVVGRSTVDTRCAPPLMDLTNVLWSPLLLVRQRFASMLSGSGAIGFDTTFWHSRSYRLSFARPYRPRLLEVRSSAIAPE